MKNKFFAFFAILLFISCSKNNIAQKNDPSKDVFIENLISQMTLDEKLGQMTLFTTDWESTGPTIRGGYEDDIKSGRCGALFNSHTVDFTTRLQKIAVEQSRLKIPLLFGYDVIHGYKTMFPIPLGEASSWDLKEMENSAYIMAKEAAASGLHWTFAPMVDISRDPRWGRVMEGSGEDTYLGSKIAEARVKGIQGNNFDKADRLIACVKHFAAYGAPAGGRDYNSVDMSDRVLRETYLPPYKAAIDAGALTVMTSFNDVDGVPASGSKYLLTDILRNEWKFDGFVVTDYTSINEMVSHGVAANETDAGILALNAGVDMDMQGAIFQEKIKAGLQDGRIKIAQIDASVRRILQIKKKIGLFEDPFKFSSKEREKETIMNDAHISASRSMAKKSIVLLKNNGILPIKKTVNQILVVGPLADDKENLIGAWSGSGEARHCVSLLSGLKQNPLAKNIVFNYVKACEIEGNDKSAFESVKNRISGADLVIVAIGESKDMSGEAASKAQIRIPGVQEELLKMIRAEGKPVVTIVMNGRPLILGDVKDNSDALIEAWWLGSQAGNAIADVLYGDYNPSGKLPISFPRHEGQIPVYYNHKSTGRPFDPTSKWNTKYLDMPNTPLFSFGYGLSYTSFKYDKPMVNKTNFSADEKLIASVNIKNIGDYDGEETIQLYIRDLVASVTRPVKELKAFKKEFLKKGESKTISFELNKEDFSFYNREMKWGTEPGEFDIFIGSDSDTQNAVRVTLINKNK